MRNKQAKMETIDALNLMICHADKGPSGFWTDDYEGCGNPAIFPEFEDGLKHGRLVQKKHDLCPWNTAILYGTGHGNIETGCYHSCSIDRARYLSEQEIKEVLIRFKTRFERGDYEHVDHLMPLLTENEATLIEQRILSKQLEDEQRDKLHQQDRLKKAAVLIKKYPNKKDLLAVYYGEKACVNEEDGLIFFAPDSRNDVVGAENLSYDEYLDVQLASLGHAYRSGFVNGIFNYLLELKGQIERVNARHICFKRIFISGMYPDGEMFEDTEDHVWMDKSGFEAFTAGDSVSFSAEVYRYVKTGNGKRIDYGLRNPAGIRKIEAYELPSDDELMMQEIRQIICETCSLSEQCNHTFCLMDSKKKRSLEQEMFNMIKAGTDKETQK